MSSIPQHFSIESQPNGKSTLVRLSGEFDVAAEEYFDRAMDGLCKDAQSIVVDLGELTFIDSTGLRGLLRWWERSRDDGFEFTVVRGSGQVRHTMELTGVDQVLPIAAEVSLDGAGGP